MLVVPDLPAPMIIKSGRSLFERDRSASVCMAGGVLAVGRGLRGTIMEDCVNDGRTGSVGEHSRFFGLGPGTRQSTATSDQSQDPPPGREGAGHHNGDRESSTYELRLEQRAGGG